MLVARTRARKKSCQEGLELLFRHIGAGTASELHQLKIRGPAFLAWVSCFGGCTCMYQLSPGVGQLCIAAGVTLTSRAFENAQRIPLSG